MFKKQRFWHCLGVPSCRKPSKCTLQSQCFERHKLDRNFFLICRYLHRLFKGVASQQAPIYLLVVNEQWQNRSNGKSGYFFGSLLKQLLTSMRLSLALFPPKLTIFLWPKASLCLQKTVVTAFKCHLLFPTKSSFKTVSSKTFTSIPSSFINSLNNARTSFCRDNSSTWIHSTKSLKIDSSVTWFRFSFCIIEQS